MASLDYNPGPSLTSELTLCSLEPTACFISAATGSQESCLYSSFLGRGPSTLSSVLFLPIHSLIPASIHPTIHLNTYIIYPSTHPSISPSIHHIPPSLHGSIHPASQPSNHPSLLSSIDECIPTYPSLYPSSNVYQQSCVIHHLCAMSCGDLRKHRDEQKAACALESSALVEGNTRARPPAPASSSSLPRSLCPPLYLCLFWEEMEEAELTSWHFVSSPFSWI